MLLIIKTNKHLLHDEEFVKPIENIIKSETEKYKIKHLKDVSEKDIAEAQKIIITGTSIQDFDYLSYANNILPIKEHAEKPVLGICAGMQILAKAYGLKLKKCIKIGMVSLTTAEKCDMFEHIQKAYALHSYVIEPSQIIDVCLKTEDGCIEAFRIKNTLHYGTGFHPEVRNEKIIKKFLRI